MCQNLKNSEKKMSRINIGGLLFDNVNIDEAVSIFKNRIDTYVRECSFCLVANQDIINRKGNYPDLSDDKLNRSFLTFADGYSIVYASKYLGTPLKERVAGPDFMDRFIDFSQEYGYKHFFLGAEEGVAQRMADNFIKRYPSIKIAGIYSPPFFREFPEDENNKIIEIINNSECDVLWVSFGCPKQERWIINNVDRLKIPIAAGVGAAFDFHSGVVRRAPIFFQKARLEWLFRLFQDPLRLWERYFNGGIKFAKTVIKQKKSTKI